MGAPAEPGGDHQSQGTHNRLVRLDDDQYLEVISVNPAREKPGHPRWFDLDNPELQLKIVAAPQLITWAVRVPDIEKLTQIPPYDQCVIQNLCRNDLRWRAALTANGQLMEGGILPLPIQWQVDNTPPHRLPDSGCKISTVTIMHPDSKSIKEKFTTMGLASPISVRRGEKAQLIVDLETPNGSVRLCSST